MEGDFDLVRKIRQGDMEAFEELIRRYQKPIYSLAKRFVKNHYDADDLAQRVFLNAFRKIKDFRGESSLKTWLYSIAINLCRSHLRAQGKVIMKEAGSVLLYQESTTLQHLIDQEARQSLEEAIEKLPEKQRLTLILRVYQELPFKEIGEIMSCSEGAAKVNFHHAINNLKKLVIRSERE